MLAAALVFASASAGQAKVLDYWIAAVPTWWSIVPNGHDAMTGTRIAPEDSIVHTVVYQRFTANWRRRMPNAPRSSADGLQIPGPLIHARVGDHLRIHFKNLDTLWHVPHSMHFHGVRYTPRSDGAYIPGFSGPGADVRPGHSFTYQPPTPTTVNCTRP